MALSTSTVASNVEPAHPNFIESNNGVASIMAAVMLTMYAAQKSKKQMRQLKRKAVLAFMKFRLQRAVNNFKSLFSKNAPANISNRTLLYILLALAILILLFISWPAAIVLLLLGILLVLLTK
jgi:phosphatidylserine synthase